MQKFGAHKNKKCGSDRRPISAFFRTHRDQLQPFQNSWVEQFWQNSTQSTIKMVIYSAKDYLTVCQMTHKSVVWRNSVILSMMKEMKKCSRRIRRKLARRLYNRRKPKNRHRNRGFAIGEMDHISDRQFREMFRIDRDTFKWLEELIHPLILRDERMTKISSGSAITTSKSY